MLALPHRRLQFFLVISNLAVRFVADSVNPRTKLLPRSFRILIEQRLNLIVVLLKQRPDLLLLFRSHLQIFRKRGPVLPRSITAYEDAEAADALRRALLHCPELWQDRHFRP